MRKAIESLVYAVAITFFVGGVVGVVLSMWFDLPRNSLSALIIYSSVYIPSFVYAAKYVYWQHTRAERGKKLQRQSSFSQSA